MMTIVIIMIIYINKQKQGKLKKKLRYNKRNKKKDNKKYNKN